MGATVLEIVLALALAVQLSPTGHSLATSPCRDGELIVTASTNTDNDVKGLFSVSEKEHFSIECEPSSTLLRREIVDCNFYLNGRKLDYSIAGSRWLAVVSADASDQGLYSCTAILANETCNSSSSLFVRVFEAPKMELFPPGGGITATLDKDGGVVVNATACLLNPTEAGSLDVFALLWIHSNLTLNNRSQGFSVTRIKQDNCASLIIRNAGIDIAGIIALKMTNTKTGNSAKDVTFVVKIEDYPTDKPPSATTQSLKPSTTSQTPASTPQSRYPETSTVPTPAKADFSTMTHHAEEVTQNGTISSSYPDRTTVAITLGVGLPVLLVLGIFAWKLLAKKRSSADEAAPTASSSAGVESARDKEKGEIVPLPQPAVRMGGSILHENNSSGDRIIQESAENVVPSESVI